MSVREEKKGATLNITMRGKLEEKNERNSRSSNNNFQSEPFTLRKRPMNQQKRNNIRIRSKTRSFFVIGKEKKNFLKKQCHTNTQSSGLPDLHRQGFHRNLHEGQGPSLRRTQGARRRSGSPKQEPEAATAELRRKEG